MKDYIKTASLTKQEETKNNTYKMKIVQNKNIYSKKIQNKWIILESNKNYIRILNNEAGAIWTMSKKPVHLKNITNRLGRKNKLLKREIKNDVEMFVKKYLRYKLLMRVK